MPVYDYTFQGHDGAHNFPVDDNGHVAGDVPCTLCGHTLDQLMESTIPMSLDDAQRVGRYCPNAQVQAKPRIAEDYSAIARRLKELQK